MKGWYRGRKKNLEWIWMFCSVCRDCSRQFVHRTCQKGTRLWPARLSSYILPKCVRVLLCWVSSVSILPLGHLLTSLCFNLCKLLRSSSSFLISSYTCLYSRYATWNYMLCHWRDPSRLILSLIHLISHKGANYTVTILFDWIYAMDA